MNVQDAIAELQGAETKNGEVAGTVAGVEHGCDEIQATVAELLGSDNESVGLFRQASEKLAECRRLAAALGAEIQAAREYLEEIE